MITQIEERQTKYCRDIESILAKLGHATNSELLEKLRSKYPDLSATTVHRATARLAFRGKIGTAPNSGDGSMRYDSNVKPHDHFMCEVCGILKDTDIKREVVPIVEASINGCRVSGRLTIMGICKQCNARMS